MGDTPTPPTPPVSNTPAPQGRPPIVRPTPPGGPAAPTAPTPPAPPAAPAAPPAPAGEQETVRIVHNGQTVSIPASKVNDYLQVGYDQQHNTKKHEIRSRVEAKATKWDQFQQDMASRPREVREAMVAYLETGQLPASAAPVAAQPQVDEDGNPVAPPPEDPRVAQLVSQMAHLNAQLQGVHQNQEDQQRETRVEAAVGQYDSFQKSEEGRLLGRILVESLAVADPNVSPEEHAGRAHALMEDYARRATVSEGTQRLEQQELQSVPPDLGSPGLNDREQRKPTMADLKSGKIKEWVRDLKEKSGIGDVFKH